MRRDNQQFVDRGYVIVAVGLGTVQRAAKFKRDLELPFDLLADREQRGYQAFGLGRAPVSDILKPKLILGAAKAIMGGARPGAVSGDAGQLPGTFIIDQSGIVRYAKPAAIASDLATTDELIAWIDYAKG